MTSGNRNTCVTWSTKGDFLLVKRTALVLKFFLSARHGPGHRDEERTGPGRSKPFRSHRKTRHGLRREVEAATAGERTRTR